MPTISNYCVLVGADMTPHHVYTIGAEWVGNNRKVVRFYYPSSVHLSVSQSVCLHVCHQNLAWSRQQGSIHHSNNDNSDNLVHGVPEGSWSGFISRISRYLWAYSHPQTILTSLGTRLLWPRIHGARIRVQCVSCHHYTVHAGHAHSTGIVPRRWNKVWERGVSVLWMPLVRLGLIREQKVSTCMNSLFHPS